MNNDVSRTGSYSSVNGPILSTYLLLYILKVCQWKKTLYSTTHHKLSEPPRGREVITCMQISFTTIDTLKATICATAL